MMVPRAAGSPTRPWDDVGDPRVSLTVRDRGRLANCSRLIRSCDWLDRERMYRGRLAGAAMGAVAALSLVGLSMSPTTSASTLAVCTVFEPHEDTSEAASGGVSAPLLAPPVLGPTLAPALLSAVASGVSPPDENDSFETVLRRSIALSDVDVDSNENIDVFFSPDDCEPTVAVEGCCLCRFWRELVTNEKNASPVDRDAAALPEPLPAPSSLLPPEWAPDVVGAGDRLSLPVVSAVVSVCVQIGDWPSAGPRTGLSAGILTCFYRVSGRFVFAIM